MITIYLVVISLLQIVSGQFEDIFNLKDEKTLKWCVLSEAEEQKCKDFAEAMELSQEFDFEIGCVRKADKHSCMLAIDSGQADLVTLDPGEVYIAGRFYSLIPIISERYTSSSGSSNYYSVAVVRANSNIKSLDDLRGARVCFSGVGHMAGWIVPLGNLMERNIMDVVDCNNPIKTAASFFGPSCAPNALNDKYNPSGDNSLTMCQQCAGYNDGKGSLCSGSDLYAGYEGAFKCMASGNGDLTFLTHTTVQELVDAKNGYRKSDYRLLCMDGTLESVDRYSTCNWGGAPPHAVVTSSNVNIKQRKKLQDMLLKAADLFSSFTSEKEKNDKYDPISSWSSWSSFGSRFTTRRPEITNKNNNGVKSDFKLFASSAKYGNYTSLMFQDTAQGFSRVINTTFSLYLGKYKEDVLKMKHCPVNTMTLCVVTEPEFNKCYRLRTALLAKDLKPDLLCVRSDSSRSCMGMIKQGMADVTVLEAADVYRAGKDFGLKPILAEQYNLDEPAYYVVAVALASDPTTDLLYLKGKRSCHTGIGTAAGWVLPINYLTRNRLMRNYGCNSVRAASEFFQKSCVPGALSREFYGTASLYSNLCHLCHGGSSSYCKRDGSEPFYGHTGALRCLVEGGGEVAFLKHTTVFENADGLNKMDWIRNMITGDFELLCRDGTRASMTDFRRCNLGKVASNAIVARESDPESSIDAYTALFLYAQQYYGNLYKEYFYEYLDFAMYQSNFQHPNQIFQDATLMLKVVPKDKQNYKDYLGKEFVRAMVNTDCTASAAIFTLSNLLCAFLLGSLAIFFY